MADEENHGPKDPPGVVPASEEGACDETKEEEGLPIYPLLVRCDINPEWTEDIVDKVNNYFDRYGTDFELFAKTLKTYMDDKYAVDGRWQCIIGDSFSIDIFCNKSSLLYMLIGGTTAVILWKCP